MKYVRSSKTMTSSLLSAYAPALYHTNPQKSSNENGLTFSLFYEEAGIPMQRRSCQKYRLHGYGHL
jgi:hypothetical protein